LPNILDTAAHRAGGPRRPVDQDAPSAPSVPMSDPGDIVARALAILSEGTAAWRGLRAANLSSGRTG